MVTSNPPCSEYVTQRDFRPDRPCGKRGKVERDGNWYCLRHDPERFKARDEARREKEKWPLEVARDAARTKAEQRQRDMEKVVRRVASGDFWRPRGQDRFVCVLCGREAHPHPPRPLSEWLHLDGCIVLMARAIVAELDVGRVAAVSDAEKAAPVVVGWGLASGPDRHVEYVAEKETL